MIYAPTFFFYMQYLDVSDTTSQWKATSLKKFKSSKLFQGVAKVFAVESASPMQGYL